MPEKKRNGRDELKLKSNKSNHKSKGKIRSYKSEKAGKRKTTRRSSGPRLPVSLRKQLDSITDTRDRFNVEEEENDDEDIDSDEGNDLYEYEEGVPEEESKKNRRYDPVENYGYELPEEFEDENVQSDDDDDNDYDAGENAVKKINAKKRKVDEFGNDVEEDDDERHLRMLQGITGMPSEAFEGKKMKKNDIISEAYPESEYNPTNEVLDGGGHISMEDLLESIQGKSGYSNLRKRTYQMDKKSKPLLAPLPKEAQNKVDRKVAYDKSKKDMTKWVPLVQRNREAPTIIFDKDTDLGFSTVGAIASEFEPRTQFEKKMASLVYDEKFVEAHKEDGAKLLELNKISMEDYKKNRDHIAKMKSLLFHHELKMKRLKKIKSKTYRRLSKKKAASAGLHMDPEAAKELAMKQEFKRAEERMTLRHKNRSKWAKRILERGMDIQDEGTRAALAEQLHQHALLTRKMNSMKETNSSDDSSDEEDENSAGSDHDVASKVLAKAKEKTLKVLEEDDEVPNSGLFSLPFMERGLKKMKEAAAEEAKLTLQGYELMSNQLDDTSGLENTRKGSVSGRRVFGASKSQVIEPKNKIKSDDISSVSGSEDESETKEEIEVGLDRRNDLQEEANIRSMLLNEDSETHQDSVFKSFDDIVKDPGPKTTYEVAIFASDKWKKMRSQNEDKNTKRSPNVIKPVTHTQNLDLEEVGEQSDADSEGEMVDGILSSGPKTTYELPSQAELIREAFAGDDVEEEFTKDKEEILNEEIPDPEKPVLLPGWGQWTHVQKKNGLPSWMLQEHEIAKRRREEALKTRRDAHLKNVVISEKVDKKAEKLHTKTLPYPFTSKEAFEQSIRMPLGPEFNPAKAIGALNRPEVVKRAGVNIKPIKFEDVDPYEKAEEHKHGVQKQKQKVNRIRGRVKAVVARS